MKHLLFLFAIACGVVSASAWADGVPLLTAGAPLSSADPVRANASATRDVVKLHPVAINRNAFGANVLTADINGHQYRFVGTVQKPAMRGYEAWSGRDGSAILSLSRETATGELSGGMQTVDRDFEIRATKNRAWVVERDRSLTVGTRAIVVASAPAGVRP